MEIKKEIVQKIARLSMLELDDKEAEKFTKDFKNILSTFSKISEADVNDTECSFLPVKKQNVLREDKVEKTLSQKDALSFTRNKKEGFFVGPRTVE